jgi:hypothetical protein
MTHKEIALMIAGTGLPNAYYQFPDNTPQVPPFICFYYGASDDVYADTKNYQRISELVIELYSDTKDFANEAVIEGALETAGLTYRKYEQFLDDEKMHETVYEMEVIINDE